MTPCSRRELRPLPKHSPGEEQVSFVLQGIVQVGEVVLLGTLLLLAVTETVAGQVGGEAGACCPSELFFGGS